MQSEKSVITKAFNKQFFDFLEDIICVFPDNNEIQVENHILLQSKRRILLV